MAVTEKKYQLGTVENPLIVKGPGFCFGKQGGKSSARQRARIFLRKTRRILC